MATQTRTRSNGRNKTTPDLLGTIGAKRGPGRPRKVVPTRTASEIADSLEAQAKKLQGAADILRGKA